MAEIGSKDKVTIDGVGRTAVLIDGGWVTIWSSTETLWGHGVFQQVFNADGTPRTDATQITPDTRDGSGDYPSVVALPNGGWVTTWYAGYSLSTIMQQVFNADGNRQGEPTTVETDTSLHGSSYEARSVALLGGGWVTTWDTDEGIFQRAYGADGSPKGGVTQVTGANGEPNIVALNDGGWVVSWYVNWNVFQQAYNADGTERGGEIHVASQSYNEANVTALSDGSWIVTWMSYDGVYQQRYHASGAPSGGEVRVDTFTDSPKSNFSITTLSDGGWVVVWDSKDQDYPGWDVYQQVYNANGTARGGETRVNAAMEGAQHASAVTALADGGWVVTWGTFTINARGYGESAYFQQAYNSDGSLNGDEQLIGGSNGRNTYGTYQEYIQEIVPLPDGSWLITWLTSDDAYQTQYRMNEKPTTQDRLASTFENGKVAIDVLSSAHDVDGDTLKVKSASVTSGFGTASVDKDGRIVYDPTSAKNQGLAGGETKTVVISYTVADTYGGTATAKVTVTVTGVNDAPVITSNGGGSSAIVKVAENRTAVTTVKASDPDAGAKLTYSISGGADKALFKIDAKTGALSFRKAPDFDKPGDAGRNNVYDVTVKVSDGTLSDTQALAVSVTNVNEAPAITSNGGKDKAVLKVAENRTAVATVKASDPDAGTKLVYSIAGGADKALFRIDAKTGLLSFRKAPDFEKPGDKGKDNVYDVTVKVSDGTLSDTQLLKVIVTDVKGKTFKGTSKADGFTGTAEADVLNGAGGNDTLKGGAGKDTLYGGTGRDRLTGGADADTFVFKSIKDSTVASSGRDTIYDFSRSQKDRIDLKAIDANTTKSGDQAFKFIGTEKFRKMAGELRYEKKGGDTLVQGDVDGDGKADFAILLDLSLSMTKGDFIL